MFFLNPDNLQTMNVFIGNMGTGKTTVAVAIALKAIKKGYTVYSNRPIKGTIKYDDLELGFFQPQPHSIIIMDETGISYDNRGFADKKQMPKERVQFIKLARHYRVKIVLISQALDIDKKFVNLCQSLYMVRRGLLCSTKCRLVKRKIGIDDSTHQLMDMYEEIKGISGIFDNFRIFRPRYYKLFDSYECPELPDTHHDYW